MKRLEIPKEENNKTVSYEFTDRFWSAIQQDTFHHFFIITDDKIPDYFNTHVSGIRVKKLEDLFEKDSKQFKKEILAELKKAKIKKVTIALDHQTWVNKHHPNKNHGLYPKKLTKSIWETFQVTQKIYPELDSFFFIAVKPASGTTLANNLELQPEEKDKEEYLKSILNPQVFSPEDWDKWKVSNYEKDYEFFEEFGVKDVDKYYKMFEPQSGIASEEFIFNFNIYKHNGLYVGYIKHVDADMFIKLRDKYVMITENELQEGITVKEMNSYATAEVKHKFGDNFRNQIKEYHGLTIVPSLNEDYKRDIQVNSDRVTYRYYNVFEKMPIQAKKGEFPTIRKFFKHIFGGEGDFENHITGDRFTVGLDWFKVAYNHPMQKLPMILLVSEEQGTGKSTLLELCMAIWGMNALKTSMEDLIGKFNSHNAFKTMTVLEEVKVEGDRDVTMNILKEKITGPLTHVEPKGLSKFTISNFTRLIAASNHEDNILKLDEHDSRFFVIKPPKITEKKDPLMKGKLIEELPAFLDYLMNDPIHHKYEDRLWFKLEYMRTAEFWNIVENTKPLIQRAIDEFMEDIFLTYKVYSIKIHPDVVAEIVTSRSKFKFSSDEVKRAFKKKGYKNFIDSPNYIRIPIDVEVKNDLPEYSYWEDRRGRVPKKRYWVCYMDDWLSKDKIEKVKSFSWSSLKDEELNSIESEKMNGKVIKELSEEDKEAIHKFFDQMSFTKATLPYKNLYESYQVLGMAKPTFDQFIEEITWWVDKGNKADLNDNTIKFL